MISYGKQSISEEDITAVLETLKSDFLTGGPQVESFEKELSNYIGCKYSLAVNSGSSALDLAVRSLQLPIGSEIITTPFTYVATSNSIINSGMIPKFVDIEWATRNIEVTEIEDKITDKTKAILFVDYAGHPCNIKELRRIADEYNLKLIEDGAHSLGAEYEGKKVGTLADITIFSFHPVKLMTTGEGGALVTNNQEYYDKAKLMRVNGVNRMGLERKSWEYDVLMPGFNYKMNDIQAALGRSQLKRIDKFINARTKIADMYKLTLGEDIEVPYIARNIKHAWHLFHITVSDRNKLYETLKEKGIQTQVHFIPIYRFFYYKNRFQLNPTDFPYTENVFREILSLPIYPDLKAHELSYIVETINDSLRHESITN